LMMPWDNMILYNLDMLSGVAMVLLIYGPLRLNICTCIGVNTNWQQWDVVSSCANKLPEFWISQIRIPIFWLSRHWNFKKIPTGISGIKNRIVISLPMGVPEIGTENQNSQPRCHGLSWEARFHLGWRFFLPMGPLWAVWSSSWVWNAASWGCRSSEYFCPTISADCGHGSTSSAILSSQQGWKNPPGHPGKWWLAPWAHKSPMLQVGHQTSDGLQHAQRWLRGWDWWWMPLWQSPRC
jgi:hypothetical protein